MIPRLEPVRETLTRAIDRLLAERGPDGYWSGELAPSALATATAVAALTLVDRAGGNRRHAVGIERGLAWLAATQQPDGGWGDTPDSPSNLSTTALVWAAFCLAGGDRYEPARARAERWLLAATGGLDSERLPAAILARYGKDRTFSVPILMMLALAGQLGGEGWRQVPQLPFEVAACPRSWFAALRLPVVSYALPALIALGQARHHQAPTANPLLRALREAVRERTLWILAEIQPASGGFLEATPLTSFVAMALVAAGEGDRPAVARAVDFLVRSQRADGSWPIDTNLATWVSTLAVNALAQAPDCAGRLAGADRERLARWLLGQQHRAVHPYTGAAPGGWAWTDLPGGVPDADDTAGALLALRHLGARADDLSDGQAGAIAAGVRWLHNLQNADGGLPTFCRGWGHLPFDRSGPDLTAHAIHAWTRWQRALPDPLAARVERAIRRAGEYLLASQRTDGAWVPLWFGNQQAREEENPTYGTARTIVALVASGRREWEEAIGRGVRWLLATQSDAGGWGGDGTAPPSIEETGLALQALAAAAERTIGDGARLRTALARGAIWLVERTEGGTRFEPAPIGLYFARLWYWERLYPIVFAIGGLARAFPLLAGPLPAGTRGEWKNDTMAR